MDDLQSITAVSKTLGLSPRMLRYYEKAGLIQSRRKEGYAYRVYDEETVTRLRQILILRKLRIPVRQIGVILDSQSGREILGVFEDTLADLDAETTALETIREILRGFVEALSQNPQLSLPGGLLKDSTALHLLNSLSFEKSNLKEGNLMDELNRADANLSKLGDVRVIYLPPMILASARVLGENCEVRAAEIIGRFVGENRLLEKKPDLRHFGFNSPITEQSAASGSVGYEVWVSVPEDQEIPEPLVRRRFFGGLYAAHAIKFGEFDHWALLGKWVADSPDYESAWGEIRCEPHSEGMDWAFEETLNFPGNFGKPDFSPEQMQLDLLMPIREKTKESL